MTNSNSLGVVMLIPTSRANFETSSYRLDFVLLDLLDEVEESTTRTCHWFPSDILAMVATINEYGAGFIVPSTDSIFYMYESITAARDAASRWLDENADTAGRYVLLYEVYKAHDGEWQIEAWWRKTAI